MRVRLLDLFFFFFSSRRRHTRFDCDWSSDVCSSDLSTHSTWPSAGGGGHEIEPEKNTLAIRHVADDPAHRQRELLDQRRRSDGLLAPCEDRLLVNVDDLELVSPVEMLVAGRTQVLDRARRPGRQTRDEQSQDVPLVAARGFGE